MRHVAGDADEGVMAGVEDDDDVAGDDVDGDVGDVEDDDDMEVDEQEVDEEPSAAGGLEESVVVLDEGSVEVVEVEVAVLVEVGVEDDDVEDVDDVEDDDYDEVEDVGEGEDVAAAAQLMRLATTMATRSSQSGMMTVMDQWGDEEVARSIDASWSGASWYGIEVAVDEAGMRGLRATADIPPHTLVTLYDGRLLGFGVAARRAACALDIQTHLNETDGWYVDGLPLVRAWEADPGGVQGRGLAAFVNHSSSPNGKLVAFEVRASRLGIYYKMHQLLLTTRSCSPLTPARHSLLLAGHISCAT